MGETAGEEEGGGRGGWEAVGPLEGVMWGVRGEGECSLDALSGEWAAAIITVSVEVRMRVEEVVEEEEEGGIFCCLLLAELHVALSVVKSLVGAMVDCNSEKVKILIIK